MWLANARCQWGHHVEVDEQSYQKVLTLCQHFLFLLCIESTEQYFWTLYAPEALSTDQDTSALFRKGMPRVYCGASGPILCFIIDG